MLETLLKLVLDFLDKELKDNEPDIEEAVLKELSDVVHEIAGFLDKKLADARRD